MITINRNNDNKCVVEPHVIKETTKFILNLKHFDGTVFPVFPMFTTTLTGTKYTLKMNN